MGRSFPLLILVFAAVLPQSIASRVPISATLFSAQPEHVTNPDGLCRGPAFEEMCSALDLSGNDALVLRMSEFVETHHSSIVDFLTNLGINPQARSSDLTCSQLCQTLMSVIPPHERPPGHDVACRRDVSFERGVVCDVDVSPTNLQLELPADEQIHYVAFHGEDGELVEAVEVVMNTSQMAEANVQMPAEVDGHQPARDWEEVALLLARMFRIYPRAWWISDGEEPDKSGSALLQEGTRVDVQVGEARLATARAWIARCNQLMKLGKVRNADYLRWFGHVDIAFIKQLYGRLLAIGQILDESIVKRGTGCELSSDGMSGTVAYVTPSLFFQKSWKHGFSSYSLRLCPLWEKVPLAEQIGTMVHEASHHKPVATDDVCADHIASGTKRWFGCGKTAYGRSLCKKLAKHDKESGTFVSFNNADNWEFFLEDVNKEGVARLIQALAAA